MNSTTDESVILDLTQSEKQRDLEGMTGPGVEKPSIPEIDKEAQRYIGIRNNRIMLLAKEIEAKTKLIALLHANEEKIGKAGNGSMRYEYDGNVIELTPAKEKLTVRSLEDEE